MKTIYFAALAIMFLPHVAMAQQTPFVGMHHLKPKPVAPPAPTNEEIIKSEIEPAKSDEDDIPALPVYKAISAKDALIEIDDLEEWSHLSEAALAHSDIDIQKLIHLIESDRGAVPPQGLFLAAKSLSDRGLMQKAALYYFVGQLRLSFDMARWPATPNKQDVARRAEESKKSADQVAPNIDKDPRLDNPHKGLQNVASQLGEPIISWTLKDKTRMDKMLMQIKDWDASAPYAYLPNYDLTEPVPFEKWEKLLAKTRDAYFSQMVSWSKMMNKVRR